VLSSLDWTKGWRILERSKEYYLDLADYSTSIIFSAMAFEAELARLYFKWRDIDVMRTETRRPSEEELEDEYRRLGSTIADRIERVALLLDHRGIDEFARGSDLTDRIDEGYPSLNVGSLSADFQSSLFWPRNRILHAGYTGYGPEDAVRAHNIASLGLALLKRMDLARRGGGQARRD